MLCGESNDTLSYLHAHRADDQSASVTRSSWIWATFDSPRQALIGVLSAMIVGIWRKKRCSSRGVGVMVLTVEVEPLLVKYQ